MTLRSVEKVHRPSRRVSPKREHTPYEWKADAWQDRVKAFRWKYPFAAALIGFLTLCAIGAGAAWIAWKGMR